MPPQTQGTIPADVIGSNQQPLPVSPPPVQDRAGLLSSVQSGIDQMNTDLQGVKAKRDTNESDVTNLLTGLGGAEKYKQQLEDQQGLTQLESQLSDVTSRISANNRLNPARLLQAEQNVIGTGVTKGMLSTRLSNVERDNAIQSLVLAAEGDMIQGRVGAANARIERAMTAKFEPMKQELEVKKFNLQRLDDRVREGQLTLSDAQKTKLNLQMGQIEKDEKDMATVQTLTQELMKNGAPAGVRDQALKANNLGELLKVPGVGSYLRSQEERLRTAILSENLSKARYENAETRKSIETASKGGYVPTGKEDYITGGFAKRMFDSEKKINELQSKGVSVPLHILANPTRDFLLSADQKLMAQSQRDFIAAKLRKESGAAISDKEIKSDAALLFPRGGNADNESFRVTRETAVNSLMKASKGGFEALLQDETNTLINPPATEVAKSAGYDESKLRAYAKTSGFPTVTYDGMQYYSMPDGTYVSIQ